MTSLPAAAAGFNTHINDEHFITLTSKNPNNNRLNNTSGNLVPAGPQGLEEAEAVDGDQRAGVEDTQLLMLARTQEGTQCL